MNLRKSLIITVLALAAISQLSCNNTNQPKKIDPNQTQNQTENHQVRIEQIEQTNNYSYLFVSENDSKFWVAIDKNPDLTVGETIFYADAMLMKDFESKELSRVFDEIYFVGQISKNPIDKQAEWFNKQHNSNSTSGRKAEVEVEALDGFSIEKLYATKDEKVGQSLKIKGVVVRFNEKIMDVNWVHIQDGTGSADKGDFDLTITTQDVVSIGDTVVFEGSLHLNKDFGAGYFYPVIMENASLLK